VELRQLLSRVPAESWHAKPRLGGEIQVSGLCCDSRRVAVGDLFFGLPGERADGALFVAEAQRRGAVAAVVEGDVTVAADVGVLLRARSARQTMGLLAALFHGEPSRKLRVVAVTGTDGKTSTVWFTRHVLCQAGRRAVAAGTLGLTGCDGVNRPWSRDAAEAASGGDEVCRSWQPTTPEAPVFQASLAELAAAGVEDVIAEVSSHALAQERVFGTQFFAAALTHVATDHLDYHKSREAYLAAKARLFDPAARGGPLERAPVLAVLNLDDELGRSLDSRSGGKHLTFGSAAEARVRLLDRSAGAEGIALEVAFDGERVRIETRLLGRFHEENLLAAAAIAYGLGISPGAIAEALRSVPPVPGRFETIRAGQPFAVIVDYAHTADGLASLLRAARGVGPQALIVVFGCGGDRDHGKRAMMGRIAGQLADRVIVTDDNPRSEDAATIGREISAGLATTGVSWELIPNRRQALARALALAGPGDMVVAAGKGAETRQVYRDHVEPFDDREVLRQLLEELRGE
jgi:UDP-N-acetylmuramoyl-L-alanyl-D-glutamate--2,6-diaminopimelate ligase